MSIPVRRGREVKAGRGTDVALQGLAAGGDPAAPGKQPGERRGPRQSRHLHVDRARGARLDELRSHRRHARLPCARIRPSSCSPASRSACFPDRRRRRSSSWPTAISSANGATRRAGRKLDDMGLTIMPGMTAGAWQYIGSQGILQGTYETFMAAARAHFGGTLAGRLLLTSGCGGMSGAQPLAGKLAGASTLVVEVDQARIDRRIASGYCDAIDRQSRRGDRDVAGRPRRTPPAGAGALRQRGGGAAGDRRARHRARHRHRPDLSRSAERLCAGRTVGRRGARHAQKRSGTADRAGAALRRDACPRHAGFPQARLDRVRIRQRAARRGAKGGCRGRLHHALLCRSLYPPAVLPGHRPVPLDRGVGQSAGHLHDRRYDPGVVLVEPSDRVVDREGARACAVHRPAGAHRLARLWRAQPARR